MPKLKITEGEKVFTPPIPQHLTSSFVGVSEKSFSEYFDFFASNQKISLNGAKYSNIMIWKFLVPEIFAPEKLTKYWPVIYWPFKKSIYLKKWSLDSFDFLHEDKYQWVIKIDRPKILEKSLDSLLRVEMVHLGIKKHLLEKKSKILR